MRQGGRRGTRQDPALLIETEHNKNNKVGSAQDLNKMDEKAVITNNGTNAMRQGGPSGRRPRGRHHNPNNGGGNGNSNAGVPGMNGGNRPRSAASLRHQTFDSNGPDIRVRGNAWQVYEKYQSLARDAAGAGDRVAAENYQQHAEHYYRIIEAINEATMLEQRQRGVPFGPQQPDIPANYYAPDGSLLPQGESAVPGAAPVGAPPMEGPGMGQAEVQPKASSPFFSQQEIDDHTAETDANLGPIAAQG